VSFNHVWNQRFGRRMTRRLMKLIVPRIVWSQIHRSVVDEFHRLYYSEAEATWKKTFWLGVPTFKCPLDLWVYQEIVWATRPDVVIETGTLYGGSALYLAALLDLTGNGRILTIDIAASPKRPAHPRIEYVSGSSVGPDVVRYVSSAIRANDTVMVILDADHSKTHVLQELRAYHPLVTPGSYLIVEDTNVNGRPVLPDHGPGPMEAVTDFLNENPAFEVDRSLEKFYLTFNPSGYLRRKPFLREEPNDLIGRNGGLPPRQSGAPR